SSHVVHYAPQPTSFPTRRSSDLEMRPDVSRCTSVRMSFMMGMSVPTSSRMSPTAVGSRTSLIWSPSLRMRIVRRSPTAVGDFLRSEEHTSELQSPDHLVFPLLLD